MSIDEIIEDLRKLRDEQVKVWESTPKPTSDSLVALAQADGMTNAISRLIELRNAQRQEQKQ
jgi:hypothetical protein